MKYACEHNILFQPLRSTFHRQNFQQNLQHPLKLQKIKYDKILYYIIFGSYQFIFMSNIFFIYIY